MDPNVPGAPNYGTQGPPPPAPLEATAPEVHHVQRERYGPFLRFANFTPPSTWRGSALLVLGGPGAGQPPQMHLREEASDAPSGTTINPKVVDTYKGWHFYRYDLECQLGPKSRVMRYTTRYHADGNPDWNFDPDCKFVLPAVGEVWRWGFYSCNGFHDPKQEVEYKGIQPLWGDVLKQHAQKPLHVLLGGGDQLYNDDVWAVPTLQAWAKLGRDAGQTADAEEKKRMFELQYNRPYAVDMEEEVQDYFFKHYISHWSQPLFSDALKQIPQAMTWDDHDIFDGWGSYPDELQKCRVFEGLFGTARRFYCIFQHHSSYEMAKADPVYFGAEGGLSWVSCLGNSVAAVMLDARSERTQKRCASAGTWQMVQQHLAKLPSTVKHLVFVATVPLLYPKPPLAEATAAGIQGALSWSAVATLLQKTGLAHSLLNQFGTVEILDDLLDHWSAEVHLEERKQLVYMMQEFANQRSVRVSFLSGDVHVGAVGYFYGDGDLEKTADYRWMAQIVSSAIGNAPPPGAVVSALRTTGATTRLDERTIQRLDDKVFPAGSAGILAARNWLLAEQNPYQEGSLANDGSVLFQIRAERENFETEGPATYAVTVPVLKTLAPQVYQKVDHQASIKYVKGRWRRWLCCTAV